MYADWSLNGLDCLQVQVKLTGIALINVNDLCMCQVENMVWKGILCIRNFTKQTVWDSGFDCCWEVGFAKIGQGMWGSDQYEKKMGCGFS